MEQPIAEDLTCPRDADGEQAVQPRVATWRSPLAQLTLLQHLGPIKFMSKGKLFVLLRLWQLEAEGMLVEVKNNLVMAFRPGRRHSVHHCAPVYHRVELLRILARPCRAANEALRISQGRSAKADL